MKVFTRCSLLLLPLQVLAFQQGGRLHQPERFDSGRLHMSVPNPLDTLSSGLASIVRVGENGLAGVTVLSTAKAVDGIKLKLYDIENSNNCRLVRELVTELDLVAEIIPSAPNSRENKLPQGTKVPCLVASLPDGKEKVLAGVSDITDFLKSTFSNESGTISSDEAEPLQQAIQALAPVSLFLASALRTGRGSQVSPAATASTRVNRPQKNLILYSYEGNQFCRLVREVLTELDLPYELKSAGKGSSRRSELAELTGGSTQCPYLVDPNTGTSMVESADIIQYLYDTYALWTPPSEILEWTSQNVMQLFKPMFATLAPLQAGSNQEDQDSYASELAAAKNEIKAETSSAPVVIYTYGLSPFSSETKALLDRLKVPYKEISLGKEWIPGLIAPGGAIKRAALLEMTGQSSLPHVFVGGKPIGGLFSGDPGILPLLKQDKFLDMVQAATSAVPAGFE